MGLPEVKDLVTTAVAVAGFIFLIRKDRREGREDRRKQAEFERKE